ncbi:diguanylate cyclase [Clostridium sp. LIBA-8841]|uniref:tetratricopeptide repeat-containing diguanylate cyclase n=1 Tax=Clostridium sp. LIBA-8841 TaxID=2987530 RepID=UPI002AC683D8|nr:diguanylate cyclase [Clostridium sp. LIBA-8841]MDZ5253495.1 diguanylate cyclase [Clostridium sp. LIBA-8841]
MKKKYSIILVFLMLIFLFSSIFKEYSVYGKPSDNPNKNYLTEKIILDNIENTYKEAKITPSYINKARKYLNSKPKNCDIYFSLGYFDYVSKDYSSAIKNFINAKNAINDASSDFVRIYTYIFLNRCLIEENNSFGRYSGLVENAQDAIKYIKGDSSLKNDTYIINDVLKTLTSVSYTRNAAINILNNYIDKTGGLTEESKIALNYYLANFYLLNFNYANATYIYLDIINSINTEKNINGGEIYKIKAYTSLGNINLQLKNFSTAIDFYQLAVKTPVKNDKIDAKSKVEAYINIIDSYTNLNYFSSAEDAAKKVPPLLTKLSSSYKDDAEILYLNSLALLAIKRKNFKEAEDYINKGFELLKNDNISIYSNKDITFKLTYANLLLEKGDYYNALTEYNEDLKESNKRGAILNIPIYEGLVKTYEALGDTEKALNFSKKLIEEKDKFQNEIDNDYIDYAIKAYENELLKEQKNREQLYMIILITIVSFLLIIIFTRMRLIKLLKKSNCTDGMTNLLNRKFLASYASKNKKFLELNEISILLIDIDYFKNYNDNYGHIKGDEVIKSVSQSILTNIDKEDFAIRYGGEELLIILPKRSELEAKKISFKIQADLRLKSIEHKFSLADQYVTISVGIYTKAKGVKENIYDMIQKSDEALYLAKNNGKNRIEVFSKIKTN